jgi:hypothetical protein
LLVSPNGKVGNALFLMRRKGYPSINEEGQLFWNNWEESDPFPLLMVGTTAWNSDVADWDMARYKIAPETGISIANALILIP